MQRVAFYCEELLWGFTLTWVAGPHVVPIPFCLIVFSLVLLVLSP